MREDGRLTDIPNDTQQVTAEQPPLFDSNGNHPIREATSAHPGSGMAMNAGRTVALLNTNDALPDSCPDSVRLSDGEQNYGYTMRHMKTLQHPEENTHVQPAR
jgi:hypothetical protein